ncbi:MAG: hypothetical protein C0497_02950 [Gemmatimonas sp.]|nr:hypothetical protein [Gemmatimonas sp.]
MPRETARRRLPLPVVPAQAGLPGDGEPFEREGLDVTVGRSASDYLDVVPPDLDTDCAPESAVMHPMMSDFARELLNRLEVARSRVAIEATHLDIVECVAADYDGPGWPWLRLLP